MPSQSRPPKTPHCFYCQVSWVFPKKAAFVRLVMSVVFCLLQEEIEIDAKALLVGKVLGVVNVELRNKKTRKLIAQGRHTMYMAVPTPSRL